MELNITVGPSTDIFQRIARVELIIRKELLLLVLGLLLKVRSKRHLNSSRTTVVVQSRLTS